MANKCSECGLNDISVENRRGIKITKYLPKDNRFPKDSLVIYINRYICKTCWEKIKLSNDFINEL